MHLWGSAGRAAEVLIQCHPWQSVEQIIVCNVESRYLQQFDMLAKQAHKTLTTIPGVRQVFSGWALSEPGQYRLCWRIQLAHADVINSYQSHPHYNAFYNQISHSTDPKKINTTFAATLSSVNHQLKESVTAWSILNSIASGANSGGWQANLRTIKQVFCPDWSPGMDFNLVCSPGPVQFPGAAHTSDRTLVEIYQKAMPLQSLLRIFLSIQSRYWRLPQ